MSSRRIDSSHVVRCRLVASCVLCVASRRRLCVCCSPPFHAVHDMTGTAIALRRITRQPPTSTASGCGMNRRPRPLRARTAATDSFKGARQIIDALRTRTPAPPALELAELQERATAAQGETCRATQRCDIEHTDATRNATCAATQPPHTANATVRMQRATTWMQRMQHSAT